MKNLTMILALMISAFTFGQDKGQYTFGVGQNFTTSDNTGNVGYFVMDGVMVSLEFAMATESADEAGDDYMNWGIGARYYIGDDGLWAGIKMNNAEWDECCTDDGTCCATDDHDHEHESETGMDFWLGAGCSKVLGFDGKLWFEPHIGISMPAETDQMSVGLGMGFRFAF